MTLYLKYRPKNLDELDLIDVGETLKKIISASDMPHAFLFAGPKGTGKTSAARILAKIINCESPVSKDVPCDKCEQCISIAKGTNLDVIELDAASHRGIDDVRSLKESIKLAPTRAKKKIYIIDEAHMLTTEASNALLKTLEEPPDHVIFILATTNPEKLISTIRSRATLISFRKATESDIIRSLKRVIDGEKLKIGESEVKEIAKLSEGAFRDAIKILEQVKIQGPEYLSKYKNADHSSLIDSVVKKDAAAAISEVEKLVSNGYSPEYLLKNILEIFHNSLLVKTGAIEGDSLELSLEELISLIDIFTDACGMVDYSPLPELPIEIAIIKYCGAPKSGGSEEINEEPKPELKNNGGSIDGENWDSILKSVKGANASIEALLRSSQPISFDGKVLTLGVYYKFHKERLEDPHHRTILETSIEKTLNFPVRVVCTLVDPPKKVVQPLTEGKDKDIIKIAEELFSN